MTTISVSEQIERNVGAMPEREQKAARQYMDKEPEKMPRIRMSDCSFLGRGKKAPASRITKQEDKMELNATDLEMAKRMKLTPEEYERYLAMTPEEAAKIGRKNLQKRLAGERE